MRLTHRVCGGDRTPERAHLPEAELIARVEADLKELLGLSGRAQHVQMSRWEQAIPQYTQEIKACHSQLDQIETHFPAFILLETIEMGFPLRKP